MQNDDLERKTIQVEKFLTCLRVLYEADIVDKQEFEILVIRIRRYGEKYGVDFSRNETYKYTMAPRGHIC